MLHAETGHAGVDGPVVTRLGLGASAIGGLFEPVSDAEGEAVVRSALDRGIRYVDTAPLYGLGASERRVGAALAGRPRDSFTVSTKVGRLVRHEPSTYESLPEGMWHVPDTLKPVFDYSRDGIRRSLSESLERLGLDHVDIAFVHDPDDALDQTIDEALPALAELRDEGAVGAIGVGMSDTVALARIVRSTPIDCVLVAGRFTLLDQTALTDLLPLCVDASVSVILGGALNSGILADPSPGARFDYAPAEPALIDRARRIADVCSRHGVPLPAAALQFGLRHPAVQTVLTGVRSVAELATNVEYFDLEIHEDLWSELASLGLIPPATALCEEARA